MCFVGFMGRPMFDRLVRGRAVLSGCDTYVIDTYLEGVSPTKRDEAILVGGTSYDKSEGRVIPQNVAARFG